MYVFLLKIRSKSFVVHQKVEAIEPCFFSINGVVIRRLVCVPPELLVLREEISVSFFGYKDFFNIHFFCSKNDTSFASEFDPTVCDKTKSRFFDEKTPDDPPHPQYNVDRRFAWEAESPEEIAFFHTNIVLGVRGIIHFFVFMKKI